MSKRDWAIMSVSSAAEEQRHLPNPWRRPLIRHKRESPMSTISTRLVLGFIAGFLSHLIFQGGFGAILYAAHQLPS